MTTTENENLENRVLVLMPTGRDASLVCASLENAGIEARDCIDPAELEKAIDAGAGAILLAEEALHNGALGRLSESLSHQPVWSDIPVVLFAGSGQSAEKLLEIVGTHFNATIVERPIRITMLVSAVRGALRAREKQYQTRDLLNQLEESDRQKDLFLATLSHELRTPLNSMLGWIRLLRKEPRTSIDTNHALDVIERNARAQTEIISDILFVSRVITGKLELNRGTFDLTSVIESAIDTIRPSAESKEIRLAASFASGDYQIEGDADRLQQVFLNLLSNAIKFTPQGGFVEVHAIRADSSIEIKIIDSGQGIKPEFLPFVFERFRQADNSYTRQVGGLGLGLAIVRHLVELHGGTVSAESKGENRGAAFTVKLPAPAREKLQASARQSETDSSKQTENEKLLEGVRLLLVEDDDDSREMLRVMFGHFGMKITAVATVTEALDAIARAQPDVLISDVGLPGEDGYELIRRVRELSPGEGGLVPAVALTGYASLQDRSLALEAGFQEHLAKPVDIDKLTEMVKNLIGQNKS